ncbi:MAG: type II/IV secretion system ATPase subunit [Candidatus Altiarchaeota archaeon]
MEADLRELLRIIRDDKRINLEDAAVRLKADKKQIFVWAEELKKKGLIEIEPHFLKAPDLMPSKKLLTASEKISKAPAEEPKETKKKITVKKPETKVDETGRVIITSYDVMLEELKLPVMISDVGDYVYHYIMKTPQVDFVTRALLDETKRSLVGEIQIETHDVLNQDRVKLLRTKFFNRSKEKMKTVLKKATDDYLSMLGRVLVNEMIGLGDIEYLLADKYLEEVVVNNSKDVLWAYHREYGWIKTNLILPTEDMIMNYSARIAREVGREITHLEPLLDAHLVTGDRVNSTLFPISTMGNTITIRRFSRNPLTMIHMLEKERKTISLDAAAFLWMAMEYELSILIAGGTASGKTTMLNAMMPFLPANHRIISIEDTRELNLPKFLHWIPLTIRPPNPRGEGEISMLDLIENALRMRPDRIIVGEVRRKRETEVLFEAMHTGHSVLGTFHAEQAYEVVDRITTPPMDIPGTVLSSLQLIVVQYRNRRTGVRRTFEIAELVKGAEKPELNTLFKWNARTDTIESVYPSLRIKEELEVFAGMNESEIEQDLEGKKKILKWLLDNHINSVNEVGRLVTQYYIDKDVVIDVIGKK